MSVVIVGIKFPFEYAIMKIAEYQVAEAELKLSSFNATTVCMLFICKDLTFDPLNTSKPLYLQLGWKPSCFLLYLVRTKCRWKQSRPCRDQGGLRWVMRQARMCTSRLLFGVKLPVQAVPCLKELNALSLCGFSFEF